MGKNTLDLSKMTKPLLYFSIMALDFWSIYHKKIKIWLPSKKFFHHHLLLNVACLEKLLLLLKFLFCIYPYIYTQLAEIWKKCNLVLIALLFVSKAKINIFWIFFKRSGPKATCSCLRWNFLPYYFHFLPNANYDSFF